LTATGSLRYKNVRAAQSCAAKNSEDDDVQLHTDKRCFWAFFFALKRKAVSTVKNVRVLSGLFVALLFVVTAQTTMAQSTIFNIPSTDTVDKGKGYVEFDYLPQVPGVDAVGPIPANRTTLINPRLVVGGPHDTEFGVNFPTFHTSASQTPNCASSNCAYIEPNFKWKFYKNDDGGVAVDAGALLHTAINQRTGQDSWGLVYANFSKKVKTGNYGPRFTAGPYGVIDSSPVTFVGPRGGVILGYEQPVQKRVSIVADWYSGKNYYGYFTPGVSITMPGNGLFNAGYSIGNNSWQNSNAARNRFLFLYYGVTF
jgi:hypothetical protein